MQHNISVMIDKKGCVFKVNKVNESSVRFYLEQQSLSLIKFLSTDSHAWSREQE